MARHASSYIVISINGITIPELKDEHGYLCIFDTDAGRIAEKMHTDSWLCVVASDHSHALTRADFLEFQRNHKIVVDHLHPNGMFHDKGILTDIDHVRVRNYADGFGKAPAPNDDTFWDWSNVRDSSLGAFRNMANKINEIRERKGLEPYLGTRRGQK